MPLEKQLEVLSSFGLKLNDGITIDDLLYSFDRKEYEEKPFDLILFVLGVDVEREPWERPFCSRVWNFDTECIFETGDYVKIVKRLCEVAAQPDLLTDIQDYINFETGDAWLKYKVGGVQRKWKVELRDDWSDSMVISYVMGDIEHNGNRFYFQDNGQAMVLFYLSPEAAGELNRLSRGSLKPVLVD